MWLLAEKVDPHVRPTIVLTSKILLKDIPNNATKFPIEVFKFLIKKITENPSPSYTKKPTPNLEYQNDSFASLQDIHLVETILIQTHPYTHTLFAHVIISILSVIFPLVPATWVMVRV